jgi:FkbM family methyltransferase
MMSILAKFFRWNNSKLVVAENQIVEKVLKIFFYLSLMVFRALKPRSPGESTPEVIRNFDSDIIMKIDRSRAMGAALYWTGFHEFREFLFLHRYLKGDMVFVDVGANLGEYSLFAAKRLSNGRVLSFEPLPSTRSLLNHNIALNEIKNIEVFPIGLSSRNETMAIHEFDDVHEGLATFYPGDRSSRTALRVQLKKLDDIVLGSALKRVDFVKIDIEGGELNALQGSRVTIERYHPVFMIEINEITYRSAGYSVADVCNFFGEFNYLPYHIMKKGRLERATILPAFGNIVFMRQ